MSRLIKPERLKRGDTIGIVAPAWSFDTERFRRGVYKLRRLGFRVKFDRSIFSRYWSMAGYDKERGEQINRMFEDHQVKAIFCAKAGYGSIRTIPYLDRKVIRRNPKIFIGYSDITFLLYFIHTIGRAVVFHGPVVAGEIHNKMNPVTLDYLLRSVMRPEPLGEIRFPGMKCLRSGRATGALMGGNMSLITSTIGTRYDVDTTGKILFLEDVGEDLETIDNYLMHMRLAGKFKRVKGIIFGRMLDCVDHSGRKYTMKNVLTDILKDIRVPVVYGFPSGHKKPGELNITLPLGVSVTLDADKGKLIVDEPGVR